MSDVDPQENMVTFYACPKDEKPYIQMAALEEGRYQEVGYLSLRTFINFSDVGVAARKAALEIDESITMSLVGYSWLEEDKSWIIVIESGRVNVVINSQRYKHLGSYTKAFYINLGVSGSEEQVREFASRFVRHLGRDPLEGLDWERFEEAEISKRVDAEAAWRKYGGQDF
ncbi:MAG: hypothetical protein ACUVV6_02595 [Thermoplasmatota archaeon]